MAIFTTPNGLYTDENGVISLINMASSFNHNDQTNFLADEIVELERLEDICAVQENLFFNRFNVEGNSLIQRAKNFQKRVDEYNQIVAGLDAWITDRVYAILADLEQYFEQSSKTTLLTHVNALSNSLNFTIDEALKDSDQETLQNMFIDNLNSQLKKNLGSNEFFIKQGYTRVTNTTTTEVIGIRQYLGALTVDEFDPASGQPIVKITGFKDMPRPMLEKLTRVVDNLNHIKTNNRKTFRNIVLDIAEKYIKNYTGHSSLDPYLDYEIKRARKNVNPIYDLTRSEASVRGFLGEIANNATIAYLVGRPGAVMPTGNVKNIKTGASIPIDAVFEQFNFQVKNYSVHEGVVSFSGSNKADYFINSKAKLSGNLAEMLTTLFGALHFNQPFDFEALGTNGSDEIQQRAKDLYQYYNFQIDRTIEKYTNETYTELLAAAQADNINEIFTTQVDKIISLRNTFAAQKIFTSEREYKNTFFKIGTEYIPSSLIIRSLINTINQYRSTTNTLERIVQFNITNLDVNSKTNSLGEFILNKGRKKKINKSHPSFNAYQAASFVRLSYEIQFNLRKLMDEAYNKVINSVG